LGNHMIVVRKTPGVVREEYQQVVFAYY